MRLIHDFKPFVPSNDYAVSKSFYESIGFTINWDDGEICEVDTNFGYRFLLLPKNHNNYAHSLMLHFLVNSAQEWYDHFNSVQLSEKFEGTKVAAPKLMPWGLLITYVWDPSGVLLHFAERPSETTEQNAA
ncbi:MAG: hypothetical protein QNJ72_41740 [Pleurocapsa sp. MO_226.B13]|nr:hypothetical protein [Pleurocapsa sp. MO_226.B13]